VIALAYLDHDGDHVEYVLPDAPVTKAWEVCDLLNKDRGYQQLELVWIPEILLGLGSTPVECI
jgi:hypothetical protein